MCGRYSLALRPSQVRAYLEDENMPAYEAPEDVGDHAPRRSYNFAPGYHGIVYRADTPDWGSGARHHDKGEREGADQPANDGQDGGEEQETNEVRYKLQSMKWGLIPFWTKRNPDYGSMLKTINCRDDSLIENRGMWNTMKQKKRCVVVAQGFYEWLKKGKDKVPHYVKRKDGQLMCWAGLWDCVQYEGSEEKNYTYTIITTSSNKQLNFLHDRMPVILENGSHQLRMWLDPKRSMWSEELQGLLKPYEGELEIYPVSKDVGKVGNNSPTFNVPISSKENKSNIANFFAKSGPKKEGALMKPYNTTSEIVKDEKSPKPIKEEVRDDRETVNLSGTEDNAPLPVPKEEAKKRTKRELDDVSHEEPPKKSAKIEKLGDSPKKATSLTKPARKTRSATTNNTAPPSKSLSKDKGSQKITSFFGK